MRRILIGTLVFCCVCLQFGTAKASDSSKRIRKIGQSLFELQQGYLELKEDYENQKKKWKSQQEKFELLVTKLLTENAETTNQVKSLRNQVETLEEQLETSKGLKLRKEIDDLNKLLNSIILVDLKNELPAEQLILDVVNNAESKISRDLLILYLARQKQRLGDLEQSMGYYSTLATEFPESPYVYRSIFEMSEIFGQWGKITEQVILLTQLSYVAEQNLYTQKAKEKLDEIKSSQTATLDENNLSFDATADSIETTKNEVETPEISLQIPVKEDTSTDTATVNEDVIPKPINKDVSTDTATINEDVIPKPIAISEDTTGDYVTGQSESDASADASMTDESTMTDFRTSVGSDMSADVVGTSSDYAASQNESDVSSDTAITAESTTTDFTTSIGSDMSADVVGTTSKELEETKDYFKISDLKDASTDTATVHEDLNFKQIEPGEDTTGDSTMPLNEPDNSIDILKKEAAESKLPSTKLIDEGLIQLESDVSSDTSLINGSTAFELKIPIGSDVSADMIGTSSKEIEETNVLSDVSADILDTKVKVSEIVDESIVHTKPIDISSDSGPDKTYKEDSIPIEAPLEKIPSIGIGEAKDITDSGPDKTYKEDSIPIEAPLEKIPSIGIGEAKDMTDSGPDKTYKEDSIPIEAPLEKIPSIGIGEAKDATNDVVPVFSPDML